MEKIDLFLIPIDPNLSPPFWPLEKDDELRLQKLKKDISKNILIQSRYALRTLLAKYVDSFPIDLVFYREPLGKPKLFSSKEVHFSLSHTEKWQAITISLTQEVGVDIEEVVRFAAKDPNWCKKEATLKRFGLGWGIDTSFSLEKSVATLNERQTKLFSMTLYDDHEVAIASDKEAKIHINYLKSWKILENFQVENPYHSLEIGKGY